MVMREERQAQYDETRESLERFVELLGAYSSTVLTLRVLEQVTDGELTPAQLDALMFIHRHGDCSAKALSEGLRISIPSSTRLVDRLVRKDLVDRRESGVDRRLVSLTVTPEGEAMLAAVREARVTRLQETLEKLPPDERRALPALLETFLRAMMQDLETVEECCRHCGIEHDGRCVVNAVHMALAGRPIVQP